MTHDDCRCELLPWDTAFFGLRVGRMSVPRLTKPCLATAADWCDDQQIACLYVLTESGDTEERELAETHGLSHVDVRVTARKRPLEDMAAEVPDARLRPARSDDIPRLRQIAGSSHRATRFYADPHFPHRRADAMYAHWIERSVEGDADQVLVAEQDGEVVGYTTGKLEQTKGRLVLLSVDERYRGLGIGRSLTVGIMTWFAIQGFTSGYLMTQAGNTPAMRLYTRLNFSFDRREHWYHWWPARTR